MNLQNIWLKKGILIEILKEKIYTLAKNNPNLWDYLIYIGIITIALWLIWAVISSRKVIVKEKKDISVPKVKKSRWGFNKKIPTVANSRRLIARLNFLEKRIEKEEDVIKASASLIEARVKKKFAEEVEEELDRRKK